MHKFTKLIIILAACSFLAACAPERNQYGVPVKKWDKLSKHEQNLIKKSSQPMDFNEG